MAANTIGRRGLAVSDMRLNLALMVVRGMQCVPAQPSLAREDIKTSFVRVNCVYISSFIF